MGVRWMPWRLWPMKDVATPRKTPGRRWQPVSRGYPNGATRPVARPGTCLKKAGGHRGN